MEQRNWKKQKPNGNQLVVNTKDNREKLAQDCVDSWDMNDLVRFAIDQVSENFANTDDEEFDRCWKDHYGE